MSRIENIIANKIVNNEYSGSENSAESGALEFESFVGLINSERDEKEYDWMSNIRIPEFASQMLTQSSIDVDQYFKSRDFVEAYLQDESDEAIASASAAKELINRTLNQKELNHYLKFVRAKLINHLNGSVYALVWWDQDIQELGLSKNIEAEVIIKDHFNYEILDPRSVRTSPEYAYSIQEKEWIIIESLKNLEDLKLDSKRFGYINLDKLEGMEADKLKEIESLKERNPGMEQNYKPNISDYKILRRFGKFWAKVQERDEESNAPTKVTYGYDVDGNILEGAELVEMEVVFAVSGSTSVLISHNVSPWQDAKGQLYRPILRGLCYVHPTDDSGIGDGRYGRDLQTAIDDTYNLSNDRVMLATMPTFKGRAGALVDNDSVYFEPEHVIELENMDDLQEIPINDNTSGALSQLSFLIGKSNQAMSIFPTTMGALPANSSTTATAVAGAESRTDIRTNYKSITFENTFLLDMYWMIQQMTYQFAQEETGFKLMGDKMQDFDPALDYFYKPVTQSIESEQSKSMKVQQWTQILGYVSQFAQGRKDGIQLVNYILQQIFSFMGDEFSNFGSKLLDPQEPPIDAAGQVEGQGVPTSNQTGIAQSGIEQGVRR